MNRKFRAGLWLVTLALFTGCELDTDVVTTRNRHLEASTGDVTIGVVGTWSNAKSNLMWEGIDLALKEINAAGGVLGRKIKVLKEDDEGSLSKGKIIAQRLADNPDVAAVIGHYFSAITTQVAPTYEFSGILMISPSNNDPKFTQQGFRRVFRTNPNNVDIGIALANYAAKMKYTKIALCYVNSDYGRSLANWFEARARELGLDTADSVPYGYGTISEFKKILEKWQDLEFDAIMLGGSMPEILHLITWARKIGIKQPIIGGTGLDAPDLVKGGAASEGIVFTSYFSPKTAKGDRARQFIDRYTAQTGKPPHTLVVQGYDCMRLLAYAMNRANSILPDKVAEAIRQTRNWDGVAGRLSFDDQGNPIGPTVVLNRVTQGRMEPFVMAE